MRIEKKEGWIIPLPHQRSQSRISEAFRIIEQAERNYSYQEVGARLIFPKIRWTGHPVHPEVLLVSQIPDTAHAVDVLVHIGCAIVTD